MATNTTGSRGGGRGRDFAVTAAVSAPRAYVPRTIGMTQRTSARVANRWAPESPSTVGRSRPLRSLAFADRLMSPWVASAQRSARRKYNFSSSGAGYAADAPSRGLASESLAAPEVSWLFPVPWYADELNWLAAGRAAVEQTAVMAAPRRPARPGQPVRPTLATSQFDQARLEYVAPALAQMAQTRAAHRVAQQVITPQVQSPTTMRDTAPNMAPLRAWSPLVPFQAAQAAELLTSVLADAHTDTTPRHAATTAAAPVFHYVAPAQLAARARGSEPSGRTVVPPTPVISPAARQRIAASHALRQVIAPPRPLAAQSTPKPSVAPVGDTSAEVRHVSSPSARAIELLTESVLAGDDAATTPVAPAAGPRVAMPAGMGGLVVGLEAARTINRPLVRQQPSVTAARRVAQLAAAPTQPLATPFAPAALRAPAPALSALAQSRPAALTHVAWSDRWLARFAGASAPTLTAMTAAEPATELGARLAAPQPIYLRPPRAEATDGFTSPLSYFGGAAAPARQAMPTVAPTRATRARSRVQRPPVDPTRAPVIADDGSTPDEVFAQIAAAAMPRTRRTAGIAVADATRAVEPPAGPVLRTASTADRMLSAAPAAPGAGMSPGLVSSPVAPLLRGLLALPSVSPMGPVTPFDVRALSPASVASSFLAGFTPPVMSLVAPAAPAEAPAGRGAAVAPARPTFVPQPPLASRRAGTITLPTVVPAMTAAAADDAALAASFERFASPLVTPAFSPLARRAAQASVLTAPAFDATMIAPTAQPTAAPFGAFDGATADAPAPAPQLAYTPTGQLVPAAALAAGLPALAAGLSAPTAALAPGSSTATVAGLGTASPAMTLIRQPTPGLAATSRDLAGTWSARPGETATMAQSWSAEQETGSTDLALDFVSPELVVAARVYGFSPAQAVQASRLAASGPAGIQAMASAVDMTFLNALAAQQQGAAVHSVQAAQLAASGGVATPAVPPTQPARTGSGLGGLARLAPQLAHVVVRAPRGAFLWPESATESLGLQATDADQTAPHSLAALDLLAANAVAEAGVFAAPPAAGAAPAAQVDTPPPLAAGLPDGFQSIYVALSETPAGRSLSPTVRAARALALAEQTSQSSSTGSSATMRAAAAWAVMPVVMSPAADVPAAPVTDTRFGDGQPSHMQPSAVQRAASVAGQSLQSLVAPQDAGPSQAAGRRGAVHRAPTAAPTLVRTGPTGASGQAQISQQQQPQTVEQAVTQAAKDTSKDLPAWFEQAAKRILAEGSSGEEGMSLAEMTLISFTPQTQVAAATRGQPEPTPAPNNADQGKAAPVMNVEALAEEVYAEVVRLLEIERERNGEPWRS